MKSPILVAALRVDIEHGGDVQIGTIENTLAALQGAVGGHIELFWPSLSARNAAEAKAFEGAVCICNENGFYEPLPVNIYAAHLGFSLKGNVLICCEKPGEGGLEFCDISPEILAEISALFPNAKRLDGPLDFTNREANELGY